MLAHEFAHELLHQRTERRKETNQRIRETEAEAVAYAVCLSCGIDTTTRSADYIQRWSDILQMPVKSMAAAIVSDQDGWGNALRQNSPWVGEHA